MNLYSTNTFQRFWGIPDDFSLPAEIVQEQVKNLFPNMPQSGALDWETLTSLVLGEGQFGSDHFRLKGVRYLYYQVRPVLPAWVRPFVHKMASIRQARKKLLQWPIEDSYVRFLYYVTEQFMVNKQLDTIPYIHFWPAGRRFAFVLTHDIETSIGQSLVSQVAKLDEKYGFHSSFNFIPEKYSVDIHLIEELNDRGFEVGVHGLKHDGRLFLSKVIFDTRVKKINRYIEEWGAAGFRSPMTHRNPEWMQELEIEYDSSFFDTDPYEPVPGGTMSIWPFQMGRFIELPYTLVQDHTMMNTLGKSTPQLWMDKVEFIRQYCGMALLNVHPDYLRNPAYFAIYEDFLRQMSNTRDYWHALPREVARWWKKRSGLNLSAVEPDLNTLLPDATMGKIRRLEEEIILDI